MFARRLGDKVCELCALDAVLCCARELICGGRRKTCSTGGSPA